MTTTRSTGATVTGDTSTSGRPGTRGPRPRPLPTSIAVVASLVAGLAAALVLDLVVVAGAVEPVITGAALLGFATGWALLALTTTWWTSQPQRWAVVPAAVMGVTGVALLAVRPDNDALTAAGWVWPPAALVLAVWMERAVRRATTPGVRWLVYPVIGLVTAAALGGTVETFRLAGDPDASVMAGARVDVGGHRLFLSCAGTGSPTVVLENGLNEPAVQWSAVTAHLSDTTRVCAYDRPGQGRSDDLDARQDGREVASDLHTLLARAGEHGPYVLAGHSAGGTLALTYAARYPEQVAGLVLLDSSSPHQVATVQDFRRTYQVMRRLLPLAPALARVGATRLVPAAESRALPAAAAEQVRAFATSPRGARNMRDEQSELPVVFRQAQALSSFDPKPLAVVTARENADGMTGWTEAQDELAALSTNSTHWVADTTHMGLLDDPSGVADSVRAITAVVTAVRTGTPVITN